MGTGAATANKQGLTILAIILLLFALGTFAFWAVFFTSGAVSASNDPAYLEHERSFPLADAYMAIATLIAAVGLFRRRSWAVLYGIMAGSGIIFLGLMDTLYALQQGLISDLSFPSIETAIICASCLILGPVTIAYIWRNRHALEYEVSRDASSTLPPPE
jgi:multisubunit Na+/H+ antiporter MnhG subunit